MAPFESRSFPDIMAVLARLCADFEDTRLNRITTYHDALQAIWNRSGYDRGFISNPFAGDDAARLGLVRTQRLLDEMGYPTLDYAIIHVAGSKGKGSTSAMIDSMLRAGGHRTGRYLSPHLHSFRERFVVNNSMISEANFIQLSQQALRAADNVEQDRPAIGTITAFELSTAMALAWFAAQSCDVTVIEVGMGGALDSTNIVTPEVSVITTLDFEHTSVLGESIAEIADNKAGIIKHERPVLTAEQPPEALRVITKHAADRIAPLTIAGQDWTTSGSSFTFTFVSDDVSWSGLRSALIGQHQVGNAGLAIAAIRVLGTRQPTLAVSEHAIRTGLASVSLPARFERVELPSGSTVIIDGAHTPASAKALSDALKENFPGISATIIIGMLADKQKDPVLEALQPIASRWIAISPDNPRAIPAEELAGSIRDLDGEVETSASVREAIEKSAGADGAELLVVTGSFSTAVEARIALELPEVIDPPL